MSSEKRMRDIVSVISSGNTGMNCYSSTADEPEKIEKRTKFIREKLDAMTEEQLIRFEFFYRSHFSRGYIKDILINAIKERTSKDFQISDEMAIVVSGLSKLFVGELVETAMEIKSKCAECEGMRLTSEQISEAYSTLQRDGKVSELNSRSFMFSKHSNITLPTSIDNLGSTDFGDLNNS